MEKKLKLSLILNFILAVSTAILLFLYIQTDNDFNAYKVNSNSPSNKVEQIPKPINKSELDQCREWIYQLQQIYFKNNINDEVLLAGSAMCASPIWIEHKYKSFKKFSNLPFKILIFDDADEDTDPNRIKREKFCSDKEELIYVRTPQIIHKHRKLLFPNTSEPEGFHPTLCNCINVQAMWEVMKYHKGYCMVLDEDCIPFRPFHPEDILRGKPFSGAAQGYPGFFSMRVDFSVWNMKIIKDINTICWDCGKYKDTSVDAGGQTASYIDAHKDDYEPVHQSINFKKGEYPEVDEIMELDKIKKDDGWNHEVFEYKFIHFRNASNWSYESGDSVKQRTERFQKIMNYFYNKNN